MDVLAHSCKSEDFDERGFCSVYRKAVLISFGRRPDCQALLLMLPARQEFGPLGKHRLAILV
jgi:hypothetical protein